MLKRKNRKIINRTFTSISKKTIQKTLLKEILTKVVCLMLIVNILTISTPAATPAMLVGATENIAQDIRYAFLSSSWAIDAPTFFGFFTKSSASTENEQISSIRIFPGSITVNRGELVVLSAIGYDSNDEPLSGVAFDWQLTDSENRFPPRSLGAGNFKATVVGTFTVTAASGGQQAAVTVTVTPPVNQKSNRSVKGKDALSAKPISSTKIPQQSDPQNSNEIGSTTEESPETPNLLPDNGGWGPDNDDSYNDPGNQPGNPSGSPADDGAGSGNFQLSAPVISLPGRGIDLALNLNYNSRVWNKSGSQMNFDIDQGFPAPGWSLGFGKMVFMGADSGCMLVDADGTRHGYSGLPDSNSGSAWFQGNTTDSSFIDYGCTVNYGQASYGWEKLPNGTTIIYSNYGAGNGIIYPTKITDAQGNYITVTYRNNRWWEIETITDTMGRIVTFQYDSNNHLISITAPRMTGQGTAYGTKTTRVLVRFHYRQLPLNYSFTSGTSVILRDGVNNPWVLDSIYYPATKTGYWFGGADSAQPDYASYYSSYGMLTKVVEQRGMNWQENAEEQGLITSGEMTKQAVYNYPLTTANESGRTNGANLSDAPTYDKLAENWAGMDVAETAETLYSIDNNAYHSDGASNSPARTITVTQPNGAISKQYSYRTPGAWTDGLVFADETIVMNGSTPTVVSHSLVSWQQGDYQSPRPSWTEVFDENDHKVKTVFEYTGGRFNEVGRFNQVLRSCDYDNGGTKLRCTVNQFENDSRYTGRHIFSLVKATGIENPDSGATLASWMEYEYDNYQSQPFTAAPDVIQHEYTHDVYTTELIDGDCKRSHVHQCGEPIPCVICDEYEQVSAYDPSTEARGNITKVTNYSDANYHAGAIYETRAYDITGNLVKTSTACCQQTSFQYTSQTQYAYPESQTRGASDPNSPDRITTSSVYSFATGLVTQATDANGRISTMKYHPDTLRPTKTTASTGAYMNFSYDDQAMTVTEESFEANGTAAGKTVKILNGVGQTKREESLGASGVWDYAETKYNKLGQVTKQSRPFRTGDTVQWSETTYDNQGRTIRVDEPDGSYSQVFYNERTQYPDSATLSAPNTLPPGNTMRVVDAWGRERWGRYDQQNRLAEVVEPKPNGDGKMATAGSLITKYQYDTLGRLTQTEQGAQQRKFKYDSLGRLTRQKLAEQTATLNDAGAFVGAGGSGANWSSAFVYDNRSNLTLKTDARGVRTSYAYNNLTTGAEDALNRLQAVIYDTSGPLEPNQTIQAAYNVTYEYMATGDKSRIKKVETPGLMKEEYVYDVEGRVSDYTQTIAYRENYPFVTSYLYDTLDRVDEVRYPAQYGMTGSPRRLVKNAYDSASRLISLKVNGTEQAGNIVYNAADQTTQIKIGAAGANQVTEDYTFDPQTGLLTNQKAQKGTTTLLDLSYEYDRKGSVGTKNGKTGHLSKIVNNLDTNKNRDYEYDALGRLTKAKGGTNNLWTQSYSYDRYGNRETVTATGVAADNSAMIRDGLTNVSYEAQTNRITTSIGSKQFKYDAAGNQTQALSEDGTTWLNFEYDAANRLKAVKRESDGAYLQTYTYSATNARVFSYEHQTNYLTIYATNGNTTLSEYTENVSAVPTWTKSYTYLGDSLLSTVTPNGTNSESTEYSHPDRLGTRVITNQQMATSSEQTTLPFGTALNAESSVTNNNKRFTSYDRSQTTGLDYAINRTYDSKQGRFTQVDPIGMRSVSLVSPQTLNLYSYCNNDPINHTDANGLFFGSFFKWIGKILKIIMIAVAVTIAVVAIIAMPSLAPQIGYGVFAKLFALSGAMLAQALAPPKIGAVIGIIVGMVLSGPGVIVNIGGPTGGSTGIGKMAKWLKLLVASNFVGVVANSFDDGSNDNRNQASGRAFREALYLLQNFIECSDYVTGNAKSPAGAYDPTEVLNRIYRGGETSADGNISDVNTYLIDSPEGRAVAQTDPSKGINIAQAFYDPNFWKGKNIKPNLGRAETFLHELKHYLGGTHKEDGDQKAYAENLRKKCISHLK